MVNFAIAFIFLVTYSATHATTKEFNYPLIQNTHDFQRLTHTSGELATIRHAIEQAKCMDVQLSSSTVYIHSVSLSTYSPTCKCLAEGFANETLVDDSEISEALDTFVNDLKATDATEIIIKKCMWKKSLTKAVKTQVYTNMFALIALLNYQHMMYIMGGMRPYGWEPIGWVLEVVFGILSFIWHLTLIVMTFEKHPDCITFYVLFLVFVSTARICVCYMTKRDSIRRNVWDFVTHSLFSMPVLMLLYNASHYHLDTTYNIVSGMVMLSIVAISSVATISHATDQKILHPSFDRGVFSMCTILLIVTLYAMIPPLATRYRETNTMVLTTWVLLLKIIRPIFCSFNNKYTKNVMERVPFSLYIMNIVLLVGVVDMLT